jgi:hypothetical protein
VLILHHNLSIQDNQGHHVLIGLINIKMTQTRSGNSGRGRGRGRTSRGRGEGRISEGNQLAAPMTQIVKATTGHVATLPKKTRAPVTTLQLNAPVFQPAITILQNPSNQGSQHGSMPGLLPPTPNSTKTGQDGHIVTINQLLHADNAKDLFTAILMELDIEPYVEMWYELGISLTWKR